MARSQPVFEPWGAPRGTYPRALPFGMDTPVDILARDALGAFCRHTHATLPGARAGPLAGLTFGLKDIYDIAGHRTGFGSPDWLATHDVAERTASVASRLLDAG